jgi:hypothetical protein
MANDKQYYERAIQANKRHMKDGAISEGTRSALLRVEKDLKDRRNAAKD